MKTFEVEAIRKKMLMRLERADKIIAYSTYKKFVMDSEEKIKILKALEPGAEIVWVGYGYGVCIKLSDTPTHMLIRRKSKFGLNTIPITVPYSECSCVAIEVLEKLHPKEYLEELLDYNDQII